MGNTDEIFSLQALPLFSKGFFPCFFAFLYIVLIYFLFRMEKGRQLGVAVGSRGKDVIVN